MNAVQMNTINASSNSMNKSNTESPQRKRRESDASSVSEDASIKSHTGSGESNKSYLRQNHREIEKRRRDKMNTYINELTSLIPTCVAMSKKIDKLTVLRLTVQHLKALKGSLNSENIDRPCCLKDVEIESLLLNTTYDSNFLFAIDSTRGKILHISDSVKNVLGYSKNELVGQSFFDILHPKDITKLKEQLSSSEISNDKSSHLSVLYPSDLPTLRCGSRRSFFCRMKIKYETQRQAENDEQQQQVMLQQQPQQQSIHSPHQQIRSDKKYAVMHCNGYLKSWGVNKLEPSLVSESSSSNIEASNNQSIACLVTVARIQPELDHIILQNQRSTFPKFQSRFSVDGKFTYVDQMATIILGYLPQELEGSSIYEHLQFDDISIVSEFHKNSLKTKEEIITTPYRLKTKSGKFLWFESRLKRFLNPWTKEIECIIAKNQLVKWDYPVHQGSEQNPSYDINEKTKSTVYEIQNSQSSQAQTLPDTKFFCEPHLFIFFYQHSNFALFSDPPNEELGMTYNNSINFKYIDDSSSSINPLNVNCSMNSVRPNGSSNHDQEDASVSAIMSLLESDGEIVGNVDYSTYAIP